MRRKCKKNVQQVDKGNIWKVKTEGEMFRTITLIYKREEFWTSDAYEETQHHIN